MLFIDQNDRFGTSHSVAEGRRGMNFLYLKYMSNGITFFDLKNLNESYSSSGFLGTISCGLMVKNNDDNFSMHSDGGQWCEEL